MSELGFKLATSRAGEREEGQRLVEYALILVLVSFVAIAALEALGGSIIGILDSIANTLKNQ